MGISSLVTCMVGENRVLGQALWETSAWCWAAAEENVIPGVS